MVHRLAACFLILFSSMKVMALDAIVSHTVFYTPDTVHAGNWIPTVEAYWQANPRKLHYTTTPEKMIIGRIKVDIIFMNEAGIITQDQYVLQTIPRGSVGELAKNKIIDLRRYKITPGVIRMKFLLTDMADSTNRFTFTDSFTVSPPAATAFFSGIQLLDTTIESAAPSPFKKNGKQQIPACTNFLDEARNVMHFYAELYQSDKLPATAYPLIQKVFISKKEDGDAYSSSMQRDTVKVQQIAQVAGSFNIASLSSGNYYLHVTLENKIHKVLTSETLFFQRLNPHPVIEKDTATRKASAEVSDTGMEHVNLLDLNKTFVSKYTLAQVRGILKMLLPFSDETATMTINNFLKNPEELYMRYYIYNYFANINKDDPERAWKEFSNKVVAVNKLFSSHGTPGYVTERGFMYLRYGPPTEMIDVENESGTLPYEIWQYNTLTQMNRKEVANAVFLFYKPNQGAFDFKLLHSTIEGELQNEAWRTYLYISGSNGGNDGNSRAEQYIGNR